MVTTWTVVGPTGQNTGPLVFQGSGCFTRTPLCSLLRRGADQRHSPHLYFDWSFVSPATAWPRAGWLMYLASAWWRVRATKREGRLDPKLGKNR